MEKIYVLVKSWGSEDPNDMQYFVKVLGASNDIDKLRAIIYKEVEPLMAIINEESEKCYDPDDFDGKPFEPYSPDVCFLDQDTKMNWFDDTSGTPYDYEIIETDII